MFTAAHSNKIIGGLFFSIANANRCFASAAASVTTICIMYFYCPISRLLKIFTDCAKTSPTYTYCTAPQICNGRKNGQEFPLYHWEQWLNCLATGGGSLFLILDYTVRCSKFFAYFRDLSNRKSLMISLIHNHTGHSISVICTSTVHTRYKKAVA